MVLAKKQAQASVAALAWEMSAWVAAMAICLAIITKVEKGIEG